MERDRQLIATVLECLEDIQNAVGDPDSILLL